MVTSPQLSVPKTPTTIPFVEAIYAQRKAAFDGARNMADQFIPIWEQLAGRLEKFQLEVRLREHNLQHVLVEVPEKPVLEDERKVYLTEYWALKVVPEEIELMGGVIQTTIEIISPPLMHRVSVHEQTLPTTHPALFEEIRKKEELCRGMIKELGVILGRTTTLKERMVTEFKNKMDYSLQRFCQIVDNEGNPLSYKTRGYNLWATPVVPRLTEEPKATVAQASSSEPTPAGSNGEAASAVILPAVMPLPPSASAAAEKSPAPPIAGQQGSGAPSGQVAAPSEGNEQPAAQVAAPSSAVVQAPSEGNEQPAVQVAAEKKPESPPAAQQGSGAPSESSSYAAVAADKPAATEVVTIHSSSSPSPSPRAAGSASGSEVRQTPSAAAAASSTDAVSGAPPVVRKRPVSTLQPHKGAPVRVEK